MVGDIKQIVSSLSVQNVGFYFKGVMYQTFYRTFVWCTGSGKSRVVIEIPWKIFCKTFMNPDCVFMCSNGSVVKFTTV